MRTLSLAVLAFLSLSLSAAHAQSWTATASTGTVDESCASFYAVDSSDLGYLSTSSTTSSITARYNVTCQGDDTPAWTTFEMLGDNAGLGNGIFATLYSFPRNGSGLTTVTSISSSAFSGLAVYSTSVSGLNCANNYYVVEVVISRTSSSAHPRVRGVRLY
jgi:hypothetical protein